MDPQQDNKDSSLDKLNQIAKGAKNLKKGIRILKTAQSGIQTAQVFLGGISTVGWAIITTLIVVTLFAFLISMLGAGGLMPSSPPKCDNPTAEPQTISSSFPTTLSITGCTENVTYSWVLPQIGGVFSAAHSATTSYTPPVVSATQKISILVNVCLSSSPTNCSQYQTPEITINKEGVFSCSKTNPADCLKEDFNIIVGGTASSEKLNDVYKLLSEVGVATSYKTLLKTSGPTTIIFVNDSSKGGGCPARVQGTGGGRSTLTLYNYDLNDCYRTTRKSRLIHETGHIIRNGHLRLFQQFESQGYYPKDGSCYKIDNRFSPRYFINTYNTSFGASQGISISGSNESLAEFIALSVIPKDGYPRRCPAGYNWTKENIFDYYVFN